MSSRSFRGIGAVVLLASAGAFATVVMDQTLEEMAAQAPLIVRGTVGRQQVRWDDAHLRINTYTEVRVTERLKGDAASILLVRQPGGEVGDVGQRVSGVAKFREGEDVVLFLFDPPDEKGVYSVEGLAAGKIAFERSKLGELRAVRHLTGLALYQREGGKARVHSVSREDLGTPDQVLERIRAAVKKGGAR